METLQQTPFGTDKYRTQQDRRGKTGLASGLWVFKFHGCFCKPVLIKTQYSFNPYILIKKLYLRKQVIFPYPAFQTSFRRNRGTEATKWEWKLLSVMLLLPPLLPSVPPSHYTFPSTAGSSKRDTVPLITCHRFREVGYQVATEKVCLGTQQEKGWEWGWGPCGH